ncbi:DUF1080 domain-containing protein [Stieleria sp. TO1_6]|uniref:3-keto-disaccharide hydrolase n=1 Tax=Stieleria tagensis TaxID=2956795 RepID=UPI00209BB062|nr:DUF1080 domain-containing protein [Stieleria tagensis]MCO8123682.1 DUF1080 domain-containing protein [Stieleria tagensis]
MVPFASAADPELVTLFNGQNLDGWHGQPSGGPIKLAALSKADLATKLAAAKADAEQHWSVENGELVNDGHGVYLATDRDYRDFDLRLEYKTVAGADSGIYLKATPQVQIWDTTDQTKFKLGADKGSGGLWNNSAGAAGKDPLVLADRPFGEWNEVRVLQVGARTSVWLNGKQVVDHAIMENYWDREQPLFVSGPIELQTHGGEIRWRNIQIAELSPEQANAKLASINSDGFESVFNGTDLSGWIGATDNYEVVDGAIRCKKGKGGNLLTEKEYGDFVARVEFRLPPGGNNGLAIRAMPEGDTAYQGMCELQVLDSTSPKYANLDPRQYHGSAYGMAAATRGYLRDVGQWNYQEVTVKGSTIKVELNGTVILDTDLATITEYLADRAHPGKDRKVGHFGFAGHGDAVEFRQVSVKSL